MAMLRELKDFRNMINKKICSDQKIVDLINDKPNSPVPDRNLLYKQVFPYAYTPDAVKETGTFICHRPKNKYSAYSTKICNNERIAHPRLNVKKIIGIIRNLVINSTICEINWQILTIAYRKRWSKLR